VLTTTWMSTTDLTWLREMFWKKAQLLRDTATNVNVSNTSLSADQSRTANVQTTPQDAKAHVTTQSSLLSLMLKVLTQAVNQTTHVFHKNVPHHTTAQHHGENGPSASSVSAPGKEHAMNLAENSVLRSTTLNLRPVELAQQQKSVTMTTRNGSATTTTSDVTRHVETSTTKSLVLAC